MAVKKLSFLLSALVALFLLSSTLEGSVREKLKLGDLAFQEGKYTDARDAYREAVVQNPKDPIPHLVLGHALFALGDYEYAFLEIRQGLELHRAPQRIHPNLLEYYPREEEFFSRLRHLRKKMERSQEVALHFLYAYLCYYSGQKKRSRAVLKKVAQWRHLQQVDRKWVTFYLGQLEEEALLARMSPFVEGVYSLKQKDYLSAHRNFLRVVRDQPALGIPALLLSHTFFALGYYKLAARYMRRGIFFRPHDKILNSLWHKYYHSRGEWIRLLLALEGYVNLHPKDKDELELLFFMYYCFKKFVSAQTVLTQLKQLRQPLSPAVKVLAKLLERRLTQEKSPSALSPKATKAYQKQLLTYGKEYFQEGDYDGALTAFQSLLPLDPRAHFLIAFAHLAKGEYPQSGEALLRGVITVSPKPFPHVVDVFSDLDLVFLKKRRLEQYLSSESNWPSRFLLAFLEFQLGKPERALPLLQKLAPQATTPTQRQGVKILQSLVQKALPPPPKKKSFQLKPYKSKTSTAPRYVIDIQGKLYPVYVEKGKKLVVYYKGKYYLYLGDSAELQPYRQDLPVELPKRPKKGLPDFWKRLEDLTPWLKGETPKEYLTPSSPLWVPSQKAKE